MKIFLVLVLCLVGTFCNGRTITIVEPTFNFSINGLIANDTIFTNEAIKMPIVAAVNRGTIRFNISFRTEPQPTPPLGNPLGIPPEDIVEWSQKLANDSSVDIVHSIYTDPNVEGMVNATIEFNRTSSMMFYNILGITDPPVRKAGFFRPFVYIFPSIADQVLALVTYFSRELGLNSFACIGVSPSALETVRSTLAKFGNKLQYGVVWPVGFLTPEIIGNLSAIQPQVVLHLTQPKIPLIHQAILKNGTLPDSTMYGMTALTANSWAKVLPGLLGQYNQPVSYFTRNVVSVNPLDPLEVVRDSNSPLGALFAQDTVDSGIDVNLENAQIATFYLAGRWLADMLSSMTEEDTEDLLSFVYNERSVHTLAGTRVGPYLDDCSISGPFGCCSSGIRGVDINQYDPVTADEIPLDPPYRFDWQECRAEEENPKTPLVFGQVIMQEEEEGGGGGGGTNETDTATTYGQNVQRGLLAAFEQAEALDTFNGRTVQLLTFSASRENETAQIAESLVDEYSVLALVGVEKANSLLNVALPNILGEDGNQTKRQVQKRRQGTSPTFAFIGTLDTKYTPLYDEFRQPVVNLGPSLKDMFAASVVRIASRNIQGIGVLFHSGAIDRSYLENIAQDVVNSYGFDLVSFDWFDYASQSPGSFSTASVDAAIFVADDVIDNTVSFVESTEAALSIVVGETRPETVYDLIGGGAAPASGSLFFAFPFPVPVLNASTSLLSAYHEYVSPSERTQGSLEGFVLGQFLINIASNVNGDVTQEKLASAIYEGQLFKAFDLTLGPYSDTCLESGDGTCCSQGYSSVHFAEINGTNYMEGSLEPVSFSGCGFTPSASDSESRGDVSSDDNDVVIGVATGVSLFAFLLILCMCIIVAVFLCLLIIMGVLLLSSVYIIFTRPVVDGAVVELAPLVEPDYFTIAFPDPPDLGQSMTSVISYMPNLSKKRIDQRISTFEDFLSDDTYMLPIFEGLRSSADNINLLAFDWVNFFEYQNATEAMLLHFAREEIQVLGEGRQIMLLREDSIFSKLYHRFTFIVGLPYLWHALAQPLYEVYTITKGYFHEHLSRTDGSTGSTSLTGEISSRGYSLDFDLRKTRNNDASSHLLKSYQMKLVAQKMLHSLVDTPFPKRLKTIISQIVDEATLGLDEEDPQLLIYRNEVRSVLVSCIFLRLIVPALTLSYKFGLTPENPSQRMHRASVLLAKILQNLARSVHFDDGLNDVFNEFIDNNAEEMTSWLVSIAFADRKKKKKKKKRNKKGKTKKDEKKAQSDTELQEMEHSSTLADAAEREEIQNKIDKVIPVPEDYYQDSLQKLFALSLKQRTIFPKILEDNLSKDQFRICRRTYLMPLGFYEEKTTELDTKAKRRAQKAQSKHDDAKEGSNNLYSENSDYSGFSIGSDEESSELSS